MSAAPQPNFPVKSPPVSRKRSTLSSGQISAIRTLSHTGLSPIDKPQSEAKIAGKVSSNYNFVKEKPSSVKLKPLFRLQRVAFGIGSVLMATSAVVYISTVPTPRLWSQEYEKLRSLQRQERELVAANETLKNDIVKQAQQEAENGQHQLSYLQPDDVIFLEATKVNPQSSREDQDDDSTFKSIPLSY